MDDGIIPQRSAFNLALAANGKPLRLKKFVKPPRAGIAMCRYERRMAYWIMARKNPLLRYRLSTGSGSRLICVTRRKYEIFQKYLVNSYQIVYHDVWRKKPNNNVSSGLRKNEFRIS